MGRNAGTLTSCYVTGSVTGTDFSVGGLVGMNSGTLTSCYATASVTGTGGQYSPAGGLVGSNYGTSGTLTSCYATGSVMSNGSRIGGLCGHNTEAGTITNCYATGAVTGNIVSTTQMGLFGKLIKAAKNQSGTNPVRM